MPTEDEQADYRSLYQRAIKKASQFRKQRDEIAEGYETLEKEHKGLAEANAKNPLAKKLADTEAKLRNLAHKEVFKAKAKGLRPEAIEDAFAASGYLADSEEIDEDKISLAIEALREKKPYFFAEPESKSPEKKPAILPPGPGMRRGGGDAPPAEKYTEEQLTDPSFMTRNAAAVSKYFANKAANVTA